MTIKPIIDETEVITLLSQFFNHPISELSPLGTGHLALVFSFQANDQKFVVRFLKNEMAHDLKKEAMVAKLLQGSEVPLPPIYTKEPLLIFIL